MNELNNTSNIDNPKGDHTSRGNYCYRYPHAAITADCVIFGFTGKDLKILLVERKNEPYRGHWALPGGFMRMDETIEQTAARELEEETNLSNIYLDQFKVYSRVDRDPRERVVTVAFIALVKPDEYKILAGDDASNAIWFNDTMLPPLAFDHQDIIREAREHIKEILRLKPVAFQLLNKVFSISELQTLYEVINSTSYDRRNFLRTAIDSEVIKEIPTSNAGSNSRGSRLYTVNENIVLPSHSKLNEERSREDTIMTSDLSEVSKYPEESKDSKNRKASTRGLFDFFRNLSSH